MSTFPKPELYETADDWLTALHEYGIAIGATPLTLGFFSLLRAKWQVRAFWDQIAEWGKEAPHLTPSTTTEDALRAAWPILVQED